MDPIHAMFRAFHTIKGIAGFLEFQSIRDVSHETETLLDLARNSKLALTPRVIDVILESADYLSREITRIEAGGAGISAPVRDLVFRITAVIEGTEGEIEEVEEAQVEKDLSILSGAMAIVEDTDVATPTAFNRLPEVQGDEDPHTATASEQGVGARSESLRPVSRDQRIP